MRPSPAHQVLAQCFDTQLRPGDDRSHREFGRPTEPDHTAQCLALRARLIECGEWDPNAVDETGMPAWFTFVLNREPTRNWPQTGIPAPTHAGNSRLSELPGGEQDCLVLRFWDAFLGDQVDLRATNGKTGETALHVVASGLSRKGDKEVFGWLVKKGLDPLAEDNKGRSSLDLAAEAKKEDILDLFRN